MSRFDALPLRALHVLLVLLAVAAATPVRSNTAIVVGAGPHLLVDDHLIASVTRVTRRLEPPSRPSSPAIGGLPGPEQFTSIPSIAWDPGARKFRMWYTERSASGDRLLYRESADGASWPGPGQVSFVLNGDGPSVLDEGPAAKDPERRFKLLYFRNTPKPMGMSVGWSSTGLSWTFSPRNPVHPYYETTDPRFPSGVGDILDPFFDAARGRYGALVKVYTNPGNEFGMQGRTQPPGIGIRLTGVMTSDDFEHWSAPRRAYVPDAGDEGTIEFYGGPVLARGDLLINFLRILRDDIPAEPGGPVEGIGYTVLAWSRDGLTWHRDRAPWFDRNTAAGTFDRAMTWVYGVTEREGRVYLAYAGYDRGHKIGNRQIGIATSSRDRYVAREAAGETGILRTRLLTTGRVEGLWLNADAAAGSIEVKVLDEKGRELLGACSTVRIDSGEAPVTCRRGFTAAGDRPLSLEFRLRRAKLYGFSFRPLS